MGVARRALLAVAGGLCLWLALPTIDLWPLAVPGIALIGWAAWGAGVRVGLLLGFLAGWACFGPALWWSGIFVGRFPWAALTTLQALYTAVMVGVLVAVQRPLLRRGRVTVAALAIPVVWVLQEAVRGSWPFGGFPWARVAFSQADSPLVRWAAVGGAPLITFVVAALGALLVHVILVRPRWVYPVAALGLVGLATWAVPVPTSGEGEAAVGMVQGDVPRAGLDFNAERRQVLDNHVRGTELLAASGPAVDVVLWPENASDIDPLRNRDAHEQVQRAVRAAGAPVLVGAVLDEPRPEISNASLLYRPGGAPPERYVKQHPVPFAEYIPHRDFFRVFSDKVDLVRADFTKGAQPAAFAIDGHDGRYQIVPTICFEVAYDGLMREAVRTAEATGDPSVLVVQTNNATFGYTAESEQQYAISRVRAVEHGRAVAHISTVGVSGFVEPDGTSSPTTELFTPAQLRQDLTVRSGLTVSDRLGPWVEIVCGLALLGAAIAGRVGSASVPAPSRHLRRSLL